MFNKTILFALLLPNIAFAADDPTKPFSFSQNQQGLVAKNQALVLQSIIYGNKVRTAVINDHMVKVGDSVGEYKVITINDKSVLLRSTEQSKTLFIFSPFSQPSNTK